MSDDKQRNLYEIVMEVIQGGVLHDTAETADLVLEALGNELSNDSNSSVAYTGEAILRGLHERRRQAA